MTQAGTREGDELSDLDQDALPELDPFHELLQQIDLEQGIFSASDASSEDPLGSSPTTHFDPHSEVSGSGYLARHAEQEARRFQLKEAQRRERNRAAQATFRQRKRVRILCFTAKL